MNLIRIKSLVSPAALLNIAGIAVAIAAFYIIMCIVERDLTFDHSIQNYKNVYLLTNRLMNSGSYDRLGLLNRGMGEQIAQRIPSVMHSGCVCAWTDRKLYREDHGERNRIQLESYPCTKSFLDVFSFEFLEGDTSKFIGPNTMVINQKTAQKFDLHVGDILHDGDGNSIEIVAIFRDFASNTHLGELDAFTELGDKHIGDIHKWEYSYFMMLHDGADFDEFYKYLQQIVCEAFLGDSGNPSDIDEEFAKSDIKLISLDELHFQKRILGLHYFVDPKLTYTMLILAVLIIMIAYINYFNFFVARIPNRIRSINTRKILGSSRIALVGSLIAESLIYTAVGAALAYFIQRYSGAMLARFHIIYDEQILDGNYLIGTITVAAACIAAVFATLYPALHITSIPPALAIRGRITQNHDSALRYILIGCQIAASLATIICATFISLNNNYLVNRDMGFNRENLYSTWVTDKIGNSVDDIESLLRQNPSIADITWTSNPIVSTSNSLRTSTHPVDKDVRFEYNMLNIAPNFFKFMDIELKDGEYPTRADGENGASYYNDNARARYNLSTEMTIRFDERECPIKGFTNDFNFLPLQYGIQPIGMFVYNSDFQYLYVRFAPDADIAATKNFIETTLSNFDPAYLDDDDCEVKSFTQVQEEIYKDELTVSAFVTVFTIITIIISVIGIFGIVLFDTQRRRKEIGIRRVNGATISEILLMFNKKFFLLVGICAVVSVPVAIIVLGKYFSGFTYHIPIHWYVVAACILAALLITAITVTLASLRAATENPANTLKSE